MESTNTCGANLLKTLDANNSYSYLRHMGRPAVRRNSFFKNTCVRPFKVVTKGARFSLIAKKASSQEPEASISEKEGAPAH